MQENVELIKMKEPRLTNIEKLYLKAYLSTLSHPKAFRLLRPDLKSHATSSNPFYKSDAVQYHINKNIILQTEALDLSADKVLSLLLEEATRLGAGSSPTARVQALTLLGKQLGLFEEKKEKTEGITFNVMNYSSTSVEPKEIEKKDKKIEENILPSNVQVKEYAKE